MKKQSIVRQLIEELRTRRMRFTEMRQFVWEAAGREGKSQQGWWSDQFKNLQYTSEVIKKYKNKTYGLTAYGKVCTKPFAMSEQDKMKALRHRVKYLESRLDHIFEERRLKRLKMMRDETGIIGRTVIGLVPMPDEMMDNFMWDEKPAFCIKLSNGNIIIPQRDPEGNGAGHLSFADKQGGYEIHLSPPVQPTPSC